MIYKRLASVACGPPHFVCSLQTSTGCLTFRERPSFSGANAASNRCQSYFVVGILTIPNRSQGHGRPRFLNSQYCIIYYFSTLLNMNLHDIYRSHISSMSRTPITHYHHFSALDKYNLHVSYMSRINTTQLASETAEKRPRCNKQEEANP